MPVKVDYFLRETGSNLRRNVTLTIASVVTILVSLTLVGVALLIRQGVENTNERWKGDVELIIFLDTGVQKEQQAALAESLESNPAVKSVHYVDREEALEEAKRLFADDPAMLDVVAPEDNGGDFILPTSFRVVPVDASTQSVLDIRDLYQDEPGVLEVATAAETIKTMEALTGAVSLVVVIAAGVLLVVAVILIFNTIRMAMFARRREIEVMKLVGATNWFIRIPYMIEGLVQGLLGTGLAVGALFGYQRLTAGLLEQKKLALLEGFVVSSSDVVSTSVFVAILGIVVGVFGSGLASSRFLDV